jgi:hypothetical protein
MRRRGDAQLKTFDGPESKVTSPAPFAASSPLHSGSCYRLVAAQFEHQQFFREMINSRGLDDGWLMLWLPHDHLAAQPGGRVRRYCNRPQLASCDQVRPLPLNTVGQWRPWRGIVMIVAGNP